MLRHVRHPNVVLFYGAYLEPEGGTIGLVFEKVNGQPLAAYLDAGPPARHRHQILLGTGSAVRFLHAQKPCIVHGDLKDRNVLVEAWEAGPRARLLDFGLSRLVTRNAKLLGGTMRWEGESQPRVKKL